MKKILAVIVALGFVLAGCADLGDIDGAARAVWTPSDAERASAVDIEGEISGRTNASNNGFKISSNGQNREFPHVVFIWDQKQKDQGLLLVKEGAFDYYENITLTVKNANVYTDYVIPGAGVFFIPYVAGKNINMVWLDAKVIEDECACVFCAGGCGGCVNPDCKCKDCFDCWCCECEKACDRCGGCIEEGCDDGCGGHGCECKGCVCSALPLEGKSAYAITETFNGAFYGASTGDSSYFTYVILDTAALEAGETQVIDMVDGNSGNRRFTFYGKAFVKLVDGNLVVNFDGNVGDIHWDIYFAQPEKNPQSDAKKAKGSPLVINTYNGHTLLYINADGRYYDPIYNADGSTFVPLNFR